MILGIGIDQIEVERMAQKLTKQDLLAKLFTSQEIVYCAGKAIPAQHFAARFCAKEAFLKALGTGWQGGFEFYEIEICHDNHGRPCMELHGGVSTYVRDLNISSIHVSLSHLKEIASAIVIIEK